MSEAKENLPEEKTEVSSGISTRKRGAVGIPTRARGPPSSGSADSSSKLKAPSSG